MKRSEPHFSVKSYAIIILAAGDSSRMGRPKQLLEYGGKSLLQRAIDSAGECRPDHLIVVLGSSFQQIKNEINTPGISIIENSNWESGIASSIIAGLNSLEDSTTGTDAAIIMTCDQPFADAKILKALITEQAGSGKLIVGSRYARTQGIPALFHRTIFPDLLSLKGDSGAKMLFEKYKDQASFVSFQNGGIDIDTSDDYKKLTK